jgi:hypothetical protein
MSKILGNYHDGSFCCIQCSEKNELTFDPNIPVYIMTEDNIHMADEPVCDFCEEYLV